MDTNQTKFLADPVHGGGGGGGEGPPLSRSFPARSFPGDRYWVTSASRASPFATLPRLQPPLWRLGPPPPFVSLVPAPRLLCCGAFSSAVGVGFVECCRRSPLGQGSPWSGALLWEGRPHAPRLRADLQVRVQARPG